MKTQMLESQNGVRVNPSPKCCVPQSLGERFRVLQRRFAKDASGQGGPLSPILPPAVMTLLVLSVVALLPLAHSATLSIDAGAGQVKVSWPGELGLVQPQRVIDLNAGDWIDIGVPTTDTTITDAIGEPVVFYRLRFLGPSIVHQPEWASALPGTGGTFSVEAMGSGVLSYQWRKDGVDIEGATESTLSLGAVDEGTVGTYDVVISNFAGRATSDSVLVSLAEPAVPPRGIFVGRFEGQEMSGGFAMMVDANGKTVILGYSPVQGQGMVATNAPVGVDNRFEVPSLRGGTIKGVFSKNVVSGSFTSTNATTEAFSGVLKEAVGVHESNAGYYEGTFGGLLTGDASLVLAADGTVFVSTFSSVVGGGGTFAMLDASNKVAATTEFTLPGTTIPGVLSINGSLDPVTHQFAGSYSFGGFQLGWISIVRVAVP